MNYENPLGFMSPRGTKDTGHTPPPSPPRTYEAPAPIAVPAAHTGNFAPPAQIDHLSDQLPDEIKRLIVDPSTFGPKEREDALSKAGTLAAWDKTRNRRIVRGNNGEPHWAAEYPNIFTFDGQLRGPFDEVHKDPAKRPADQQIGLIAGEKSMRGPLTDVIIETDQGERILIRKTSGDVVSARKQTFDMITLDMAEEAGKNQEVVRPRPIATETLADIILAPGMPMRLGYDPHTGETPHSKGNITRIIGLEMDDDGKVSAGHPRLKRPELYLTVREDFNMAMRRSHKLGGAALNRTNP